MLSGGSHPSVCSGHQYSLRFWWQLAPKLICSRCIRASEDGFQCLLSSLHYLIFLHWFNLHHDRLTLNLLVECHCAAVLKAVTVLP